MQPSPGSSPVAKSSVEAMQDYYAARAAEYDRIYLKPERQADLRNIEAWLPPIFAGSSVLEVACGTGYWTQFIAPVASRMVALDSAAQTMRIARSTVASGKVEFVVGDAYALPLDSRRYQRAFAGFWFSHEDELRAVTEGRGMQVRYRAWQYYWALEYVALPA